MSATDDSPTGEQALDGAAAIAAVVRGMARCEAAYPDAPTRLRAVYVDGYVQGNAEARAAAAGAPWPGPETAALLAIQRRREAATAGPWQAQPYSDDPGDEGSCITAGVPGTMAERAIVYAIDYPWTTPESCQADAEFIAHAHADIAYLLDVVQQQSMLLADADARLARWRHDFRYPHS